MVPPKGDKATSANRKQNTSGNRKRNISDTTSAVPSKKSSRSPAKNTPIIILTNFADEERYKFEILFISYKVSRWQLNEAIRLSCSTLNFDPQFLGLSRDFDIMPLNMAAYANRKRNSPGTTSAVPSTKSSTSPAKKTPIIILTNFADKELYKFEILFTSYKVSRWQLNEAMLSALWVAQNQHQQA